MKRVMHFNILLKPLITFNNRQMSTESKVILRVFFLALSRLDVWRGPTLVPDP